MAYTIYNNDGTVLSTIAVGDVDSYSTSLDLIGKNVNNFCTKNFHIPTIMIIFTYNKLTITYVFIRLFLFQRYLSINK
jgi:hypothetical protein